MQSHDVAATPPPALMHPPVFERIVNSFKIKKPYYIAKSEYAKVKFFVKKNGNLYIKAKFYDNEFF